MDGFFRNSRSIADTAKHFSGQRRMPYDLEDSVR
jgi:hypothetical protein